MRLQSTRDRATSLPAFVENAAAPCRAQTASCHPCCFYCLFCFMPCPPPFRPGALSSGPPSPAPFLSGGGSRSLNLSELKPAEVTASLRPGPPRNPASLKAPCMALASSAVSVAALYFERIDFTVAFCCSVSEAASPGRSRASLIPGAPLGPSPLWAGTAPEKRRHMHTATTAAKIVFFIAFPFFVCWISMDLLGSP